MTIAIEILLAAATLCIWLGCAGYLRLRTTLDRIHCVAFVNATSGTALSAAAFVADGASSRALKIVLITLASLLIGAATAHVTGRALLDRGSAPTQ